MFRVALKELLARKRRLVTTGIAITLGIAFLTGTQLLSGVLNDSIESLVESVYDKYDVVVRSPQVQETGFGQPIRGPIASSVVAEVQAVPGVEAADGVVEAQSAQLMGKDGKTLGSGFGPPTIVSNALDAQSLQIGTYTEGDRPTADNEIALDFSTADNNGFTVGDEISVATQDGVEKFDLVGLNGLGEAGDQTSGSTVMIFTTPTAQRLAKLNDQFNYIAVAGDPGVSQDALAERIAAQVPAEQTVTGAEFIRETQDQIAQFVDILSTFVSVFGYIALIVAAFIIYNTFSIIVAQRSRETALLRAIGAKRRQVLSSTLIEATAIGLVASLIGLAVGLLLASGLKAIVGQFFTVEGGLPPLTVGVVVLALVIGLGVTILSAVAPAIRSTRIAPVAAMSEVAIDRSALSRSRLLLGTGLLVLGVGLIVLGLADIGQALPEVGGGAFLVLLTVSIVLAPLIVAPASRLIALPFRAFGATIGRLSGENAARNPKRTAATAAALTIGVTLVTLIAVLANSIRASVNEQIGAYNADFIVNSNALNPGIGIPPDVQDQISDLPDVKAASPVRFGLIRLLDEVSQENPSSSSSTDTVLGSGDTSPPGADDFMLGIDPGSFFDVVDSGDIEGSVDNLTGDTSVALLAKFAEEHHLSVGDELPVYFAETGVQNLTVEMTFEKSLGQADVFVPMSTFEANQPPFLNVDNFIYVQADDGADLAALRTELDKIVADSPSILVQDLAEFAESQSAPLDTFLAIIYGLLGLAIVIALIGIANTLSLSILERTRELGLLRAVGMKRAQVVWSVLQESAIIAVFGTLLGLLIGIVFSVILSIAISADNPDLFTFQLPYVQLVVISLVAGLAGIVAAVLPARRAARLDILKAVSSQ